jgi:hypothetical protein
VQGPPESLDEWPGKTLATSKFGVCHDILSKQPF